MHKSGGHVFEIGLREIKTSGQNDSKNGWDIGTDEIWILGKVFRIEEQYVCQTFDYESVSDNVKTSMDGWCGNASSGPVPQVDSGQLGHISNPRHLNAGSNQAKHNLISRGTDVH